MKVEASHPHHTNLKGRKGGSLPAVNNNHVAACGDVVKRNQDAVNSLKVKLPSPVTRLKK